MTRPTENQLAEALADLLDCPLTLDEATFRSFGLEETMRRAPNQVVGSMSIALVRVQRAKAALAAYRSAQQAEAGAAGGAQSAAGNALDDPRLQELFSSAIDGALTSGYQGVAPAPAGHWLEAWWKRGRAVAEYEATLAEQGRQQGMEQATATIVQAITDPENQPSQWGTVLAQPAASSAQEPQGEHIDPKETVGEIAKNVGAWETPEGFVCFGSWMAVAAMHHNILKGAAQAFKQMLAAAPTRLAGAAQGEAVAWLRDQRGEFEGPQTLDPFFLLGAEAPGRGRNGATYSPLYAHPQAQVERKPIRQSQGIKMWHEASSAHKQISAFDWFTAGILAAERHHGIGIPTASTASDEGSV